MGARVEPELTRRMSGDPKTSIEAILTATGGLEDLLAQLPPDVRVDHTYRLTHSVAVTASAAALRKVAQLPAVQAMEPVRDVGIA